MIANSHQVEKAVAIHPPNERWTDGRTDAAAKEENFKPAKLQQKEKHSLRRQGGRVSARGRYREVAAIAWPARGSSDVTAGRAGCAGIGKSVKEEQLPDGNAIKYG